MTTPLYTRFAPSPTGALHLGHTYAAMVANHFASQTGGAMILRIDDLDHTRCKLHFTKGIFDDLQWLGINWHCAPDIPANRRHVPRQSTRLADYRAAITQLQEMNLLYPCYLSRRELANILSAPHGAPSPSFEAIQNTESILDPAEITHRKQAGQSPAWRLRMQAAITLATAKAGDNLAWFDHITGWQLATPEIFGDVVIARADIAVSYHLAVVVDDSKDQVNLVTRGADLAPSTHLHRLLQTLLDLPVPTYCHHQLIRNKAGVRLAKRDLAHSLTAMRDAGATPVSITALLPPMPVLAQERQPNSYR